MQFNQTHFVHSAATVAQLLPDNAKEIAFIGRSNAGKSSAINCITGVNRVAHSSKTPGRTQLINYFQIAEKHFFVDLPGYGYAKISREIKKRIEAVLNFYLQKRQSLLAIILIIDCRHPLHINDNEMLHFLSQLNLPIHILLTKADKLTRNQAMQALQKTQAYCRRYASPISSQLFSATKDVGLEEVQQKILQLFEFEE